jgi:hypothetical protein
MSAHIVNTDGATIHVTQSGAAEPTLIFCTIAAARHELGKALLIGSARPFDGRQGGADRRGAPARRASGAHPHRTRPATPMPVPDEQRAAMLASYGSREGVLQAFSVLAGSPLSPELHERVIEDTCDLV